MTTFTKTNTPEFQQLVNSRSKEEIADIFLDHLKTNFPIPQDIKVTLTLSNQAKKNKRGAISAIVIQDRTLRTSDITVFKTKTTDIPEVLSSIGHEYKHILQSFVEGCPWVAGKDFNIKNEVEASVFGIFKSRKFCYGW